MVIFHSYVSLPEGTLKILWPPLKKSVFFWKRSWKIMDSWILLTQISENNLITNLMNLSIDLCLLIESIDSINISMNLWSISESSWSEELCYSANLIVSYESLIHKKRQICSVDAHISGQNTRHQSLPCFGLPRAGETKRFEDARYVKVPHWQRVVRDSKSNVRVM